MHRSYRRLGDILINVHDHGGDGPPLLLIHGLGGSAGNWGRIADPLTAHARVVAPDLPGHGRSGPSDDYSLDTHVAAVVSLISSYGWSDVTLMGNSMGALIAMLVAGRHPHLVRSLLLLSPATPPVRPAIPADPLASARLVGQSLPGLGLLLAERYTASRTPEEQIDEMLALVMASPEVLPSDIRADAIELAALRRTMPWATRAFVDSAGSIRRLFVRPGGYSSLVRSIDVPTTMIFGEADRVVIPESLRWLARRRQDWRCIELRDVGHTPMLERPDIVIHETIRRMNVPEPPGGRGDSGKFGHSSPSAPITTA